MEFYNMMKNFSSNNDRTADINPKQEILKPDAVK